MLIKPNGSLALEGYVTNNQQVCAYAERTKTSDISSDSIAHTLVNYNFKKNGVVTILVSYITTKTVAVSPTLLY